MKENLNNENFLIKAVLISTVISIIFSIFFFYFSERSSDLSSYVFQKAIFGAKFISDHGDLNISNTINLVIDSEEKPLVKHYLPQAWEAYINYTDPQHFEERKDDVKTMEDYIAIVPSSTAIQETNKTLVIAEDLLKRNKFWASFFFWLLTVSQVLILFFTARLARAGGRNGNTPSYQRR